MFELIAQDGRARRARLSLPHGQVETPVFMPVGTLGSVKSLVPADLESFDTRIVLANTYHLFLRPGMETMERFGGLHKFMAWPKPILTDSGGYQIFSLASQVKLSEEGARFASHIDGRKFTLTPEQVVNIQETINSDIQMVLDECTPYPATHREAGLSLARTIRWAQRARQAKLAIASKNHQFGIVQGGIYEDLRTNSAKALQDIDFEGYAIGGLSVGEPKEALREMTDLSASLLPTDKPRYLMGVGTPQDILEAVNVGVDMFDCVMPTRHARRGAMFTSTGHINIRNAKYRHDDEPLDASCSCYTCKNFSRTYLRHLFIAGELTALRLLSLHNIAFYLELMAKIRQSIEEHSFANLLQQGRDLWGELAGSS